MARDALRPVFAQVGDLAYVWPGMFVPYARFDAARGGTHVRFRFTELLHARDRCMTRGIEDFRIMNTSWKCIRLDATPFDRMPSSAPHHAPDRIDH